MAAHGAGAAQARRPVVILPYRGYGTARRLVLPGRVLEGTRLRPARASDRRWRNLATFLSLIESDEVPFARLRARFNGMATELQADREGYFRVEIESRAATAGWHEIELQHESVTAKGRVLVPPADARFGVISDIDDTVVQSNVTRKLRMLVSLALSNARTRKPFPGCGAFYRALHAGRNPFFYVSKSPWNLYVPLAEYLELQGLPEGPLFLRNLGLRMQKDHKCRAIGALLEAYPRLPFILIGDSGERDPEVYTEIVRRHPHRIRAIYIRAVDRSPGRLLALEELIGEVRKTGCQLVLAQDSEAAAAHAAGEGLIQPSDLRAVRADCVRDAKA